MSVDAAFWTAVGAVIVAALALLAAPLLRRRRVGRPQTVRVAAWVVAAATSASVFAGIAVTVVNLKSETTAVDILALAVSGVITLALLTRGFASRT